MVDNTGIRWRRMVRQFRQQPWSIQALAAGSALVLVVSVALVGVRSGDETTPTIEDRPEEAAQQEGSDPADPDEGGRRTAAPETSDASTASPEVGEATTGGGDTSTTGGDDTAGGDTTGGGTTGGDTTGGEPGTTGTTGGDTTTDGDDTGGTDGSDPGRELTASDRGVSPEEVKIVFPWFDLAATFQVTNTGNEDIENAENAIEAFVNHINDTGGIDGRQIDPIIEEYNPLNEQDMRNKCRRWAEDDKVFGVVDAGGWHTQHQLCLTEDHDTPLVSEWTTVKEWTQRGDPYLWWTAADAEQTIENLFLWGRERDLLTGQTIGLLFSDRESDKLAREFAEPLAEELGIDFHTEVIPFDNAAAQAAVPQAVQRMRANGVDRVVSLLPFTTFAFWLNGAETQEYFPHYVLSDYESTLVVAQALLGAQYPESLDKAIGPTTFPLGEVDDPANYSPQERRCNDIWKDANPDSENLDIGGVGMRWCQNIFLFVEAATAASERNGGFLTRENWAQAMGTVKDRPSQMTPILDFAPDDKSGPTQAKVVEVHTGHESEPCSEELDDDGNGVCHIVVEGYGPYRTR